MNLFDMKQGSTFRRMWLARVSAAALAVTALASLPPKAEAGIAISVGVSVGFAPPVLPVYEQPPIPGPGYLWTPGYWAWDGMGYYWVPGAWVLAPFYGALWTPPYWGWVGGMYVFHPGYWGRHIGFYGGINYGYGYVGTGYVGGYWGHGGFYYNRSVNRIQNVHITNVYNRTVINNTYINRTSYNGGRGGIMARPTPEQMAFAHQRHYAPVAAQQQQMRLARQDPSLRASYNHGMPPIAATPRAGVFHGRDLMAARATPASFAARRMQGNSPMALRSASYAPHDYRAAPAADRYARTYQPRATYRPQQTYRPQAYHPVQQSSYRPEQYRGYQPHPAYRQYRQAAYRPQPHRGGSRRPPPRREHHGG